MECTHLLDNVKVDNDLITEDSSVTKNWDCSECVAKDQNWLCLQCGVVNCGRYVSGHAKLHAEMSGHQLCLNCDEYSVYCYKCDDYVSNDTESQTIDKIRQSIMKVKNVNNGSNLGNEENSKDGSEPNSCSSASSGQEPSSSREAKGDAEAQGSSETDKRNKNTKTPEEMVRSLRPRSRKRSHSDDSSSAEGGRSNKKGSPCNGKTQREKKVVGLKNLGNTCFMNAVLQSLSNIQEFSCYFSQLPALEPRSISNGRKVYHSRSITRQEMTDLVMAEELRKVLINLNNGCGGKGAISPECLFLVIWKVVPRFRGYQQQDAHEFLRYMLDRLHTELLQLLPEAGLPAASIVTAVFGGTLQSEVRCLACGAESKKLDPFLDLSLELPDKAAPVSLLDCLASFVQVEELADTERYFCNSCGSKQKSTKQFRVRRLPQVLCLHIKRFRWHNYFRTKVDTSISFPLRALDMSQFVLERRRAQLYDLAAVIVHHGSGAGSGHYTAFAHDSASASASASDSGSGSGRWFHFNDHSVRVAAAAAVQDCKPYILFYIRQHHELS